MAAVLLLILKPFIPQKLSLIGFLNFIGLKMNLIWFAIASICFFFACSYAMSFTMVTQYFRIFNDVLKLYDSIQKRQRSLEISRIKVFIVRLTFLRNLSCILHWTITFVTLLLFFFCLEYTNFEKDDLFYRLGFGLSFVFHFVLHFYHLCLFRETVSRFNEL